MGAYLAGASQTERLAVKQYGHHIGLLFQIQDDILDVEGDQIKLGKQVGSDQDNEKSTYPKLLGIDGAIKVKEKNVAMAIKLLEEANIANSMLASLVNYISDRDV